MSLGHRVRVLLAVVAISLATALPVLGAQGPTKLESASVSPDSGSTATLITFQVTYRSVKDLPPEFVRVTVAGATHAMTGDGTDWKGGVRFTWRGTLPVGSHDVLFRARDTEKFVDELGTGPIVIGGAEPTPRPTPPDPTPAPDPTPDADPTVAPDPGGPGETGDPGEPGASSGPSPSSDPSGAPAPSIPAGPDEPAPSADPADGDAATLPPPDARDGWWLDDVPASDDDPTSEPGAAATSGGTRPGSGPAGSGGGPADPGTGGSNPTGTSGDQGFAASIGRWFGSLGDAAGSVLGTFLDVLVGAMPGSGSAALGGTGTGSLPTVPTMVLTTSGVGLWMAFMLFGKRRRDEEAPAPDAELRAAAATGSGRAGTAILAAAPVPMFDAEALMPRWRRPSLLEARKTDPVRAPAAARPRQTFDNAFGDLDPTMERRLVRYAVVQLLDRPDEVFAERIGEVEAGDEVVVVAQTGVYRHVRCPDGRQGWIHRMTLGDIVAPARDDALDADASGPSIDAAGAMAALLAARGLR